MRVAIMLVRRLDLFHRYPMTMGFGSAGYHGARNDTAMGYVVEHLHFCDRTNCFVAAKETRLHKEPIG